MANKMKKSIPDINLVNFTVARYYSEKNRYSRKVDSKYVLSLSDEEKCFKHNRKSNIPEIIY